MKVGGGDGEEDEDGWKFVEPVSTPETKVKNLKVKTLRPRVKATGKKVKKREGGRLRLRRMSSVEETSEESR